MEDEANKHHKQAAWYCYLSHQALCWTFLLRWNRWADLISCTICHPGAQNTTTTMRIQTYRRVHVQNLFVTLALEEKAVRVVINHLIVWAGGGGGHLRVPVVVAAEKKRHKWLREVRLFWNVSGLDLHIQLHQFTLNKQQEATFHPRVGLSTSTDEDLKTEQMSNVWTLLRFLGEKQLMPQWLKVTGWPGANLAC